MKNQNSKVLFLAQAAMIAAIYVVLTVLGASLAFGEVIRFVLQKPSLSFRSLLRRQFQVYLSDASRKYFRRCDSSGYYLWKHCNFNRSRFYTHA